MKKFDSIKPTLFGLAFATATAYVGCNAAKLFFVCHEYLLENPQYRAPFDQFSVPSITAVFATFAAFCAITFLSAIVAAFARRPWSLFVLRNSCILTYILFWLYFYSLRAYTDATFSIDAAGIKTDDKSVALFFQRWDLIKGYIPAFVVFLAIHLSCWMRATINLYTGRNDTEPAWGDRFLENVRNHGPDPRFRKSCWTSVISHLMVIIIIPWLLEFIGCVEPYRVPKGSGNPVVAMVKMVKPKKKKKKKYILRPDAVISFKQPDLDDSQILQQVQEATELTYKASANANPGKMGTGGGKEGGWPQGMENGKIRFIRIEHKGPGWDDGMDVAARADMNFLEYFHKLTGFKIGDHPESHPMRLLAKYPKGYAPPFIYITGDGTINASDRDMKILRDYLLDGGMLFGDAGSPAFDRAFRGFISTALPGFRLVEISDDDPIFQQPFAFPNGAPPLWHHGGSRALGVKYKERWIVFYHPGDINDAWKTGGSGMRQDMVDGAYQMGVNILYYSFTRYLELTVKYRK